MWLCAKKVGGSMKRPQLHLNGYFSFLTIATVSHLNLLVS